MATASEPTDLEIGFATLIARRIAFLMMMHDAENQDEESLALFAVEQAERLAADLQSFYGASTGAEAAVMDQPTRGSTSAAHFRPSHSANLAARAGAVIAVGLMFMVM